MSRILIAPCCLMLLCLLSLCFTAAPAQAACRDDCYESCCTEDGTCRSDDSITCLTDCLKDCDGQNVPDVPAPTPVDPEPEQPADEPAPDNGSGS